MAIRVLIMMLPLWLMACQMPADTRLARYQLAQGEAEPARQQLRVLAEAGDASAQVEYGKLVAADEGASPAEAMMWYQRAWAQQDYSAGPASLRLFKRYQGSMAIGEQRARAMLVPLRPRESEQDLRLALDVAVLYPGAASEAQWLQWLSLYRRSCIQDCFLGTYSGRYHQQLGQFEQAEKAYLSVLHRDPRAVEFLQEMDEALGQVSRFVEQVRGIRDVASLDGDYCLRVATLVKASLAPGQHDSLVMDWLQRAREKGSTAAIQEQLSYMLMWPDFYDYSRFTDTVTALMPYQPRIATFYRAQGDLQEQWFHLRPERAEADLLALLDQGFVQASLPLASLYEKGFLGESDMAQAVHYYSLAAEAGLSNGDEALASIYASGRGIAKDPIRAYAHSQAAQVLLPRTASPAPVEDVPLPDSLLPAARQAAQALIAKRRSWLEEQFHVAVAP
ncbi:alginate biosynthesis regulator [Alcanivorax hongdengensis A-11-3]|uniref:Alginate biosynthesis regulator n=1 Tax=Alcanivorax hongdengensis A-11-3 TaxID=1177179 RepID=L0WE37_9GAMM|nr:sel1 repeat family protein [Alcanivorax hongdengensis]EKF74402.1 alginate biosynthesis regulator [Alcanivorax hongdengensis A-11-3]